MAVKYVNYEGVIEIHNEIISTMGGKFVIINDGNLSYCVESVRDIGDNSALIETFVQKAAYYIWCISLNHAFLDGNKRTAFQVAYVFLIANGFELQGIDADEVVTMLINVTTKQITIENVS
jgi:death on curing protein